MKFFRDKEFSKMRFLALGLILVLVASNLATIYWFKEKKEKAKNDEVAVVEEQVDKIDSDGDGLTNEEEINKYKTDPTKADTDGDGYSDKQELDSNHDPLIDQRVGENEIVADWQEWPVKTDKWTLFGDWDGFHKLLVRERGQDWTTDDTSRYLASFTVYNLGTVTSGAYLNNTLYILEYNEAEGPSFGPQIYRIVKNEQTGKIYILTKQSMEIYFPLDEYFNKDEKTAIKNLEPQAVLDVPNSSLKLVKVDTSAINFVESYTDAQKVFKYNEKDYVYKSVSKGCFIVRANDGTAREYYFDLPFAEKRPDQNVVGAGEGPVSLKLTWDNGATSTDEYTFKSIGGCGSFGCYDYPSYIKSAEQLNVVGSFSNGDKVYVLRDKWATKTVAGIEPGADGYQVGILQDLYNSFSPGWDEQLQKEKTKISFDQFVADNPVLYWQDPFGNFIQFRKAKYLPAVECGKPVIYLYPQKTTTVSVQVAPTGGFTITEPAYNNGWKVEAQPSGELKNLSDGKVYPYLFWEGRGLDYQLAKDGFVVAKADVEKFLSSKLNELGLNKKEAAEFMEYWLPRMQSRNYYFVTFVPQKEFDKIAPLKIEPKPETIIRVFMDYQGIDEKIEVREQKIITPKRQGFTVVEWGGALHD